MFFASGELRTEALCAKPLPEPLTSFLYHEFPGHIKTVNSRNVTVDCITFKCIKFELNK